MKPTAIAIGVAVVVLIAVAVFATRRSSSDNPVVAVGQSEAADAVPTPQYLLEHPDLLKAAEQKCREGGDPASLYCSNVHRAESLRMADQYRRSLKPKGSGQ
jgi:hypothetical protein